MIPAVAITGLILAGGRSTRMGNSDKGLQLFNGLPLAAHAIARLAPQVGTLAININRNETLYAPFGLPLWPDLIPDFAGPLAGLHTGLSRCHTPYMLSVPCDSPLLPVDLATRLAAGLEQAGADLALAVTEGDDDQYDDQPGSQPDHRHHDRHGKNASSGNRAAGAPGPQRHPVFCLMKTALLPQLDAFLRSGERKMEKWMTSLAMVDVFFDDRAAFSNINTLHELQQLEQRPS